ncbi:MAG TPA: transposase, partial [Mycobacteriales bacterium]|nr:transposase [Mycobacteriales bacterium]
MFTPEYRAEAVQLVLTADKPIAEIARDLGIGESTLGNWVAKAKEKGVVQDKPLDVDERAELKRL